MTTLGERLKLARESKNLSQQEVAERAGMSQPTYFKIESGKTKRTTYLTELARVLGVSADWLTTGDGNKDAANAQFSNKSIDVWHEDDAMPDGMVAISYLPEVCGSLGNGYVNEDPHDELKLWFRQETIKECNVNPEHAKAIVVAGESMAPELIDGQTIAVDTSAKRIFDGEIYAFRINEELKVKYLFKHGDGFKAVSRNDDKLRFPDEFYSARDVENESIEIIGQYWWKSETRRVRR